MPAPKGHNFSVGNDGGAPKGNSNAAKHYGQSDPEIHFQRLCDDEAHDTAERLVELRADCASKHGISPDEVSPDALDSYIAENTDFESPEEVTTAFEKLVALRDQVGRNLDYTLENGLITEDKERTKTIDGQEVTIIGDVISESERFGQRLRNKRERIKEKLGMGDSHL